VIRQRHRIQHVLPVFGGAEEQIETPARKISACSWRLTKIDSSVVKTSARLPISITRSAFSASMTAPGPTGIPRSA